jgi:hypothetical protein
LYHPKHIAEELSIWLEVPSDPTAAVSEGRVRLERQIHFFRYLLLFLVVNNHPYEFFSLSINEC